MAKFRYRMQNILSVKEKLETQAKNDFAIAAAIVNEEEEKLKSLIERQEGYRLFLKKLQQGELDFKQIKETTQAIESLKYLIEDQKRVLDRAEKNLEIRRVALAEAMQDVKTHEKLKERQFAEYMAEEAARESKEIDELVSYRFGQAGDQ
ncbi:MAG: flagellar export protein FliJ [Lachnospiraceae bacterium]|nr:flagellar export protein FliJ [Lachnospiraceae bacterium]